MRILLCLMLALVLTACGGAGLDVKSAASTAASVAATAADAAGAKPPAPLAATAIDEQAVTLAAKAVDFAALSVPAVMQLAKIEPGSPPALKLAGLLDRARDAVNAAAAARQAGNAASYREALAHAEAALAEIKQFGKE